MPIQPIVEVLQKEVNHRAAQTALLLVGAVGAVAYVSGWLVQQCFGCALGTPDIDRQRVLATGVSFLLWVSVGQLAADYLVRSLRKHRHSVGSILGGFGGRALRILPCIEMTLLFVVTEVIAAGLLPVVLLFVFMQGRSWGHVIAALLFWSLFLGHSLLLRALMRGLPDSLSQGAHFALVSAAVYAIGAVLMYGLLLHPQIASPYGGGAPDYVLVASETLPFGQDEGAMVPVAAWQAGEDDWLVSIPRRSALSRERGRWLVPRASLAVVRIAEANFAYGAGTAQADGGRTAAGAATWRINVPRAVASFLDQDEEVACWVGNYHSIVPARVCDPGEGEPEEATEFAACLMPGVVPDRLITVAATNRIVIVPLTSSEQKS